MEEGQFVYVTCPLCGDKYEKQSVEEDTHRCPDQQLD